MTTRSPHASQQKVVAPLRWGAAHCKRRWLTLTAVLLALLAPGCATIKKAESTLQSPFAKKRQERRAQTLQEFEAGRNQAEFQSALTAWDQGNLKTCEPALQSLLQRQPKHRDARLLLVDLYLAKESPAEASREMDRALADHPDDAQVQYSAALLRDAMGQQDEALAYYRRATAWAPDNEVFRIGYYAAREAANRRNAGTPNPFADVAGLSAGEAVAEGVQPAGYPQPNRAQPPRPLPPKSEPASGKVTYADPADLNDRAAKETAATLIQRGRVALSEGNKEAAIATFREALTLSPQDPQIPLSAATAALRYDQPQIAIQILQAVEPRLGQSAAIQRALGLAYYRAGDYPSAQTALQQALSLDKSSGLSYFLLGCTLAKMGQPEAAEGNLRQAAALDPRYAMRR